jgi:hypothetical protein
MTVVEAAPVVSEYTQALAKRVIRKIDMRVLLIMFVTYNLNFMDKTVSTTQRSTFLFICLRHQKVRSTLLLSSFVCPCVVTHFQIQD